MNAPGRECAAAERLDVHGEPGTIQPRILLEWLPEAFLAVVDQQLSAHVGNCMLQ